MNHRSDTDTEALQRAYLLKHAVACSGQVLAPRTERMTKRVDQLIKRYSRRFGFPIY